MAALGLAGSGARAELRPDPWRRGVGGHGADPLEVRPILPSRPAESEPWGDTETGPGLSLADATEGLVHELVVEIEPGPAEMIDQRSSLGDYAKAPGGEHQAERPQAGDP